MQRGGSLLAWAPQLAQMQPSEQVVTFLCRSCVRACSESHLLGGIGSLARRTAGKACSWPRLDALVPGISIRVLDYRYCCMGECRVEISSSLRAEAGGENAPA